MWTERIRANFDFTAKADSQSGFLGADWDSALQVLHTLQILFSCEHNALTWNGVFLCLFLRQRATHDRAALHVRIFAVPCLAIGALCFCYGWYSINQVGRVDGSRFLESLSLMEIVQHPDLGSADEVHRFRWNSNYFFATLLCTLSSLLRSR